MKRARAPITYVRNSIGLISIGLLALAGCDLPTKAPQSQAYIPPPPLALVAIVDPASPGFTDQIHQLEDLIRASATPGESLVVMLPQARVAGIYLVKGGDSLSSIAATNGLTLSALEAANPQFGPLSGRSWWLIHPGERVTLPNRGAPDPLILVTKAPSGPPPPALVRIPQEPSNPTDFQRAEYEHALAAAKAINDARIAEWQAAAAREVAPWQTQVVGNLDSKLSSVPAPSEPVAPQQLAASMTAGATTLQGIQGRRLLLLLGGGEVGPAQLAPRSLAQVNVVIANLPDSGQSAPWTAAARAAGATSVNALDRALTQLQLGQIVNQ